MLFSSGLSGLSALNQLVGALALVAAAQRAQTVQGVMVFLKAIIDNEYSTVKKMIEADSDLVSPVN